MDTTTWAISISGIALLVSFVSAAVTIYRSAPSTLLYHEQMAVMRIVASRTMVLWDQLKTIATAQVSSSTIDLYMLSSYQKNALRLEEASDKAIGIGLLSKLMGNHKHSFILYVAFVQSLNHIATLEKPDKQPLEEWTKQHFSMGLVRLVDILRKFDSSLLPQSVYHSLYHSLDEKLTEEAWTYLDKAARQKKLTVRDGSG